MLNTGSETGIDVSRAVKARIKRNGLCRRKTDGGEFVQGFQHGDNLFFIVCLLGDKGCHDEHGAFCYHSLGVVALIEATAQQFSI